MSEVTQELKPWEVPPDEWYWQALLEEGECARIDILATPQAAPQYEQPTLQPDIAPTTAESGNGHSAQWQIVMQHQKSGEPVQLSVINYNRGGLLVNWDGLTGFVPASQISARLPHGNEQQRRDALAARIGETLTLRVIESDPANNRLIMAECASAESDVNAALLNSLRPGSVIRGQVTNLCSFGAFVDLGGLEGLIHISELSWGRVSHPDDILQVGQDLDVYVLNVSPDQERVALSLKRLHPDPWINVESRYAVGQIVAGTVTSIVNFGVFVRLEEGLEGLIHASELDENNSSGHALRENDTVQVQILSIDGERHRLSLALQTQDVDSSPAE